jgi:hypothetical protein
MMPKQVAASALRLSDITAGNRAQAHESENQQGMN